jgi:hypothetical protein
VCVYLKKGAFRGVRYENFMTKGAQTTVSYWGKFFRKKLTARVGERKREMCDDESDELGMKQRDNTTTHEYHKRAHKHINTHEQRYSTIHQSLLLHSARIPSIVCSLSLT